MYYVFYHNDGMLLHIFLMEVNEFWLVQLGTWT